MMPACKEALAADAGEIKNIGTNKAAAHMVGKLLAEKCKEAGRSIVNG